MVVIHFGLTIHNSAFTEYCFIDHPLNDMLFENKKKFKKVMLKNLKRIVWDLNLIKKLLNSFPVKKKLIL